GIASIYRSLAGRRAAERGMQHLTERLQLAIAAAELGTWDLDLQTGVLVWSERCRAMFGIGPDAPVSMEDFYAGLHPDDRERITASFAAATDPATRGEYDIEYRTIGKEDGIERWVASRGRGIFNAQGRGIRAIGTAIEITGRRRDEQRLRELAETLERRVAERTAELVEQIAERERAETALVQAQKLEAVGQLTSGIAHDFNNLLTVILGGIERLRAALAGEERELRRLDMMAQAAQRGAQLTSQLLAFARRQRLTPRALDLNESIAGMKRLLGSTIAKTVQIRMTLSPVLWPALVDPAQIELVILNLALNARDAMPKGGTLTIETANAEAGPPQHPEEPPPGEYVVVAVTDTGAGMAPEIRARAFEPFFTTKGAGRGSGLGLSQVFGLAKQSGGGVRLRTSPGEGTSVRVYLPRAAAPAVSRPR
ncbi:MAG: ATP-binding protein, partial [Acetobacteraceae bacterium]